MAFSPCPECARHVRVADDACPFCGSDAPRPAPRVPRRSTKPVTRAALFFAGVLGATACGEENQGEIYGGPPVSQGDEDDPGMADIYGGPPVEEEPAPSEDDETADDEAMPVEAYGAPSPPPEDP